LNVETGTEEEVMNNLKTLQEVKEALDRVRSTMTMIVV